MVERARGGKTERTRAHRHTGATVTTHCAWYPTGPAQLDLLAEEGVSPRRTIIGHCDLLERGYPDPNLQRDLATVVRQAQRIEGLLSKMRHAAHERMKEVEAVVSVNEAGIPSSPEEFEESGGGN